MTWGLLFVYMLSHTTPIKAAALAPVQALDNNHLVGTSCANGDVAAVNETIAKFGLEAVLAAREMFMLHSCLLKAALNGRLNLIKMLLDFGAEVDELNNQKTALYLAAWNGRTEVVRFLIDAGANVDAKDPWGRTPLHGASFDGSLDIVRLLLERGAEVDPRGDEGDTPLRAAIAQKRMKTIVELIAHGATMENASISTWILDFEFEAGSKDEGVRAAIEEGRSRRGLSQRHLKIKR